MASPMDILTALGALWIGGAAAITFGLAHRGVADPWSVDCELELQA